VVPVALAALPGTSMPQEGTVCQSSPTVLASGPIARSGDAISIELHQPDSMPAAVPAVWATAPGSRRLDDRTNDHHARPLQRSVQRSHAATR
jgi:hypothetical protein